jgi:hypothetical protein
MYPLARCHPTRRCATALLLAKRLLWRVGQVGRSLRCAPLRTGCESCVVHVRARSSVMATVPIVRADRTSDQYFLIGPSCALAYPRLRTHPSTIRQACGLRISRYVSEHSFWRAEVGLRPSASQCRCSLLALRQEDANEDVCCICGGGGTLVCCDGCPSSYHVRCVGESKASMPETYAAPLCLAA